MSSCACRTDNTSKHLFEARALAEVEDPSNGQFIRLGDWLEKARRQLASACKPFGEGSSAVTAGLPELRLLAAHVLGISKTHLIAHPDLQMDPEQRAALHAGLARLQTGEALPYILGDWEFFGRTFTLSPHVLIPRPETEMLVEQALDWSRQHPHARRFADTGTGSGCIAASLALECPNARVTATDISAPALQTAHTNLDRYDLLSRVHLVQCDLLGAFAPGSFDIVCANLPYIPSPRLHSLAVANREPWLALDGGPDGLALIRRLISQAARLLAPGGLALLEIDDTHTAPVLTLAYPSFGAGAHVLNDYEGKPRLLRIEKEN